MGLLFKKIRRISYDSAVFHGSGIDARYSTDTGIELRIRSELDGLEPKALAAVDTDRYAKLWGLASFGRFFWPLLPIRLDVRALSLEAAEEERWRTWFIGTLSENLHRWGLPAELDLTFSGERLAPRTSAPRLAERVILMSGGGKDSAVSGELLKGLGIPFDWFTSGTHAPKEDAAVREIAKVSGGSSLIRSTALREVKAPGNADFREANAKRLRRLDRKHRKRYREGNWLSLMSQTVEASLVAEATGSRYVLQGNERSANAGNGVHIGDLEVNHQYGKSYALEREFSSFLARYLHPELQNASLLMPFYDLQVGKIFASHPQYFSAFRSCNHRTASCPWCLECPKCAFVFLILSAFVDEEVVSQIFQGDLLVDPGLVKTFMELCGRSGHKPLECVGHEDESLLALHLASKRRTATPVHPDLVAILPGAQQAEALQKRILQAYNDENGLSSHWNDQLRKIVHAPAA